MPIYEFFCENCNAIDEVVRPMHESAQPYDCPECYARCTRKYTVPNVQTEGEQIPYIHPAFGTVMTDKQAKAEAKARGWVEVGDDDQESISPPTKKSYESNDYFV
jgi:putative FmdB family regulatory protein